VPHVNVNGIRLYYEDLGTGPAVVFVHGLGSSTRDWSAQLQHFKTRHRVIALDLRGHGRSDKPSGPYSIPLFAEDLSQFLVELAVTPACIVGLSLGGMVGFQLGVDHPQQVARLVIVNSGPAVVPRTLRQKWEFKRREWIVRLLGMRRMGQVLADRLLPEPAQRQLHDQFVDRWEQNDRRAYLASLRAIVGWTVLNQIPELAVPVLVISADNDYTTPEQKRAWMALLRDARLEVVSGSRHMTPIDQPEAFNAVMEGFLDATANHDATL